MVRDTAHARGRYRNRKGDLTTNVLGVCSPDAEFIFVLPGWEGSAADGRVLRDALRRTHGLKLEELKSSHNALAHTQSTGSARAIGSPSKRPRT